MSQLYFYLFSHRKLFFCCARKITCMEIVCWLSVNGRESNTFPLTLSFPVVSLSHVHSCFEKEVFMLQLFDVGSCLRARGTSGLSKRSDAESRAWACRPASGEETVVLCPCPAQIILNKAKFTCAGCYRTGVEPKLLCPAVREGWGRSCCWLLLASCSARQHRCWPWGQWGSLFFFLPALARVWTLYIWRSELR